MENNILISLERFSIAISVSKVAVAITMIILVTSIGILVINKKLGETLYRFGILFFSITILSFIGLFYFENIYKSSLSNYINTNSDKEAQMILLEMGKIPYDINSKDKNKKYMTILDNIYETTIFTDIERMTNGSVFCNEYIEDLEIENNLDKVKRLNLDKE